MTRLQNAHLTTRVTTFVASEHVRYVTSRNVEITEARVERHTRHAGRVDEDRNHEALCAAAGSTLKPRSVTTLHELSDPLQTGRRRVFFYRPAALAVGISHFPHSNLSPFPHIVLLFLGTPLPLPPSDCRCAVSGISRQCQYRRRESYRPMSVFQAAALENSDARIKKCPTLKYRDTDIPRYFVTTSI